MIVRHSDAEWPNSFSITLIELETEAEVPGVHDAKFQGIAEETKKACPVSKALSATKITLKAVLKGGK
jgi:osmotically inducible protein OsmC